MLSLHVLCRALRSKIVASQAAVPAVSFVPHLTGLHCYSLSYKISTSCTANAPVDGDIFYANGTKQTRVDISKKETSVFSAGSFRERGNISKPKVSQRRTTYIPRRRTNILSLPTEPLGSNGWSKLKEQAISKHSFEVRVTSQMASSNTDYKIAKSFLSFVAEQNGDVSYEVLLNYLFLCVSQNQSEEVRDLYDIMKMKFHDLLDTSASNLFIRGFSKTDHWRESLNILEFLKKVGFASARSYGYCIKAAIEHHDAALAWTLYHEMIQNNILSPEGAIQSLFDAPQHLQDDGYRKNLLDILTSFRENQMYPKETLMESIKSWFESIPNASWKGTLTHINNNGHCQSCKHQIESIQLTPEEYSVLMKNVLDGVIKGEDIFRKTTPEELKKFLQYVGSRDPYDYVVDGLNMAHTYNTCISSYFLLNVVSCLAEKGKRVLVLGRKHMLLPSKKWAQKDIQQLRKIADCFFLENISLDDPFLIYASITSGSHCCFLTRDLLRDHKACLRDPKTQQLFYKWQRGHQLGWSSFTPEKIHLKPVLSYDTVTQFTDDSYHIPYDKTDVARATYEVPKTWLCLKKDQ